MDDLIFIGTDDFLLPLARDLKKSFQIGSLDETDVMFCGQRIIKQGATVLVHQDLCIEDLHEALTRARTQTCSQRASSPLSFLTIVICRCSLEAQQALFIRCRAQGKGTCRSRSSNGTTNKRTPDAQASPINKAKSSPQECSEHFKGATSCGAVHRSSWSTIVTAFHLSRFPNDSSRIANIDCIITGNNLGT